MFRQLRRQLASQEYAVIADVDIAATRAALRANHAQIYHVSVWEKRSGRGGVTVYYRSALRRGAAGRFV